MIKQYQQEVKQAKEKLLNEILKSNLSKYEKLKLIHKDMLFDTENSLIDLFKKRYDEFNKMLIKKGNEYPCIDDLFVDDQFDRYQTVYFDTLLDNYTGEYSDENEFITILTNRTTDDIVQITKEEFIDTIYDYAIKNKSIGFEIDW